MPKTSTKPLSKIDAAWLENYQKLVEYKERSGHCHVPSKDPILGGWVRNQRKANNKNEIRKDRKRKLNKIGFDWDPKQAVRDSRSEAAWEKVYQQLVDFYREHGHCQVPSSRELQKEDPKDERTKRMKKLVTWVTTQRARRKATDSPTSEQEPEAKGKPRTAYKVMPQYQIDSLDTLGFDWNPQDFDKVWDKKFSELEQYKTKNGDCLVPKSTQN